MNSIILLVVLLALYYYIYMNYYDFFEYKYHIYFYIFVSIYLILLYIYHFEYELLYKLLKNVHEINHKPLYQYNNLSNSQLIGSEYPNIYNGFNIKETLLHKQNGRCNACSNFIMNNDISNCKLKYKKSLNEGGINNIENIGLVCPHCFEFNKI